MEELIHGGCPFKESIGMRASHGKDIGMFAKGRRALRWYFPYTIASLLQGFHSSRVVIDRFVMIVCIGRIFLLPLGNGGMVTMVSTRVAFAKAAVAITMIVVIMIILLIR